MEEFYPMEEHPIHYFIMTKPIKQKVAIIAVGRNGG
jgi:hypothetical protein